MTEDEDLVELVSERALTLGSSVATAESLTCGAVASRLGAGADASRWFRGGVVAYAESVKFEVLDVDPGPVVTRSCAEQMAVGVRSLLRADTSVALTGVGGPDPAEGCPPGTVYLAVSGPRGTRARQLHLHGEPEEILAAAVTASLRELLTALEELSPNG